MASPVIPAPPQPPAAAPLDQQLPPVAQPTPDAETAALRQQISRQGEEVARLRNLVTGQSRQPQQPHQPTKKELEVEFFNNPLEMTAAIAQRAVATMQQQQGQSSYDTLVEVARARARERNPELFDKYIIEVQAKVASVDPQFHTNINVWSNAFSQVLGDHIDELRQPKVESPRAPAVHISQEAGPAAPSGAQPPAPKAEKITPEEHHVAKRLGLTDEQYMAGKVHYNNQNDDPFEKSSWDEHITFDSKEKRRRENEQRRTAASKK